jgi:hypothetical protein
MDACTSSGACSRLHVSNQDALALEFKEDGDIDALVRPRTASGIDIDAATRT